jgi:diguanylate cyclase (GGDEF)-like protein
LTANITKNPEISSRVEADLIRHLYKHLSISQLGSAGALLAIIVGLWEQLPSGFLLVWVTLHTVVTLGRLGLLVAFRRQDQPDSVEGARVWGYRFTVGALQAGLVWGWAAYHIMTVGSLGTRVLVLFALGGILAGASQAIASWMKSYFAFCIPLLLPPVFWLVLQNQGEYQVMALLMLFFLVASVVMARELNRTLAASFRVRYENLGLIQSLGDQVKTRERTEQSLRANNSILQMLATQNSPQVVLDSVCRMVEGQLPGIVCSIQMQDEADKRLRVVSAPSLPDTFHQVINSMVLEPSTKNCAIAVHDNTPVFVENIAVNPLWANYRDIALAHKIQACHCVPIRDMAGNAIGSFSLYYSEPHVLTSEELECLQSAANLAGVVVERTKAEQKLHLMAHYDALTSLPNRTLFMDRLKQTLAWAKRSRQKFALLFIDLDRFKAINDLYGHGMGDLVLQEAAKRLRSCVRDVDTAARMGGDEFTVLISDIRDSRAPLIVANKLIASLCEPIEIGNESYSIGASVGISIYPSDARDADKLIGMADAAMYRAKQIGGNVSIYYSSLDGRGDGAAASAKLRKP